MTSFSQTESITVLTHLINHFLCLDQNASTALTLQDDVELSEGLLSAEANVGFSGAGARVVVDGWTEVSEAVMLISAHA